jgi:hypothetical protein
MSLFKHAMVSGINDALVDGGLVSWPNEKVGFEVCAKVAADLNGPDMLPEGGLAKESAILIGTRLKEAADLLISKGYSRDASSVLRTKQAAQMDFSDRAAMMAEACMSKAAADASLTDVGPNTAESAAQTDQHAALDQKNRPANKYLAGVGNTRFPNGGVVGQQMVAPERQAGPAISNSLTALDKQANEDMSAGDLGEAGDMTPGATPGALQRAMMFLQALKNKGYQPGAEAQVAAGGLGQAGEPGMEVMAHVLETVKTAAEADDIISQILHHQGQAGELASPELVEAIQRMMEHESQEGLEEKKEEMPEMHEAKSASLLRYLKSASEGSLTDVGPNTEESAAKTDQVAQLDLKNRSMHEYLLGVGNTAMPNRGQVYAVEKAPKHDAVHTDNLPTNETKSAELAYVESFRKIASELGPQLPATMPRETKVAHLQTLLGLPPGERSGYVKALRVG